MTTRTFRRIAVYCGSSSHVDPRFLESARAVGVALAKRGIGVVYGGGKIGLMGEMANGALAAGGEVIGVITEKLQGLEVGHPGLTELFVVTSMQSRKTLMAQLSDGFIALPGGVGTMEEVFEAATWSQLNYHLKPVGLLNDRGYYDHLIAFLNHANDEKFIRDTHTELILNAPTLDALLVSMSNVELPRLGQWKP